MTNLMCHILKNGSEVKLLTNGQKSRAAANKGLPKVGVQCFYDILLLNRTLVFQMNSSAEKPRLRQALERQTV